MNLTQEGEEKATPRMQLVMHVLLSELDIWEREESRKDKEGNSDYISYDRRDNFALQNILP